MRKLLSSLALISIIGLSASAANAHPGFRVVIVTPPVVYVQQQPYYAPPPPAYAPVPVQSGPVTVNIGGQTWYVVRAVGPDYLGGQRVNGGFVVACLEPNPRSPTCRTFFNP